MLTPNPPLYERFEAIFSGRLTTASFKKGDYVYWEDSPSRYVYGIRSGVIKVVRNGFHGKEWIVRLAGEQEVIALCDLVDKRSHSASAVALCNSSVWRVSAQTFRDRLARDPKLREVVHSWMVRHIRRLEISLELFSNGKAEERIANLLARLTVPSESNDPRVRCIPFRLTRKDMAEMVGITPETCSRTLSEFKRSGLVREEDDRLLYVDMSALKRYFTRMENGALSG